MTARTLMNPQPMSLRPTDTVATATALILSHHLRHLPVVDAQGRYVGTFSIYSLLRLTLPKAVTMKEGLTDVSFVNETTEDLAQRLRERGNEPVLNWLSTEAPVMHSGTSSMEIMLLMLQGRTTSIPVVDKSNQRLEGIISFWDVFKKLTGEDA